jgi:peroxiredoxin
MKMLFASILFTAFALPVLSGPVSAQDLMPLGTEAPDFSLPDVVSGKTVSLKDFKGQKALAVVFICRHCPFVQHYKAEIAKLAKDYQAKGLGFVTISANDPVDYPADAPESLKEMAREEGFVMPLLFDESQATARAYTAVSTPDFFLFDAERKLVYRGQLDDSRPRTGKPVTGADARAAIDAVLEDRPVSKDQKPSIGCSIKWKR